MSAVGTLRGETPQQVRSLVSFFPPILCDDDTLVTRLGGVGGMDVRVDAVERSPHNTPGTTAFMIEHR